MTRLWLSLLAAALLTVPAMAQDDVQGIAFSQAPEQALGVCMGADPAKTIQCAVQKCVAGGAAEADCAPMNWCLPMGWSADLFLQHQEGVHWHEFLCGWGSKEAVEAAAKVKCDSTLRPYLLDCTITGYWDPDGKEIAAN